MVRALIAIMSASALVLAAGGLAKSQQPNVRGSLERGPVMPVCIEGRACDAPAPGVLLVFSQSGTDVRRLTTGVAGRFALRLEPGLYSVRVLRKSVIGSKLTPATFRVPASGAISIRLHLDTGIR